MMVQRKMIPLIKNFIAVADSLAINGAQTRKALSSDTHISPSTLSKILNILLDYGIICERRASASSVFILKDTAPVSVIDLSQRHFAMHICTIDGKVKRNFTSKSDDRFFPDENLTFFLKDCAEYLRRYCGDLTDIYIISDNLPKDEVNASHVCTDKLVRELSSAYFNGRNVYFRRTDDLAVKYVRCMSHGENALALSSKSYCLCAAYVTDNTASSFSLIRNLQSSELLRSKTSEAASRAAAFALGNTVSLLGIQKIVFDRCLAEISKSFAEDFRSSINRYLEADIISEECIRVSNMPLRLAGAVCEARSKYITDFCKKERNTFI